MPPKTETIHVQVQRVLFPKLKPGETEAEAANGDPIWYILQTDSWVAKGSLTWRPRENERLVLVGSQCAYKGQLEFRFTSATPDIPTNPRDILTYASELTHGIGPAIEEKIWQARGADWRSVTVEDVPELGQRGRLAAFQETIDKIGLEIEKTKTIGFIMAHKGTLNLAALAWAEWGIETIARVTENPYILSDLPHYGFAHIDGDIRRSFDITDPDPRRIRAGLIYGMKQLTERHGTAVGWHMLAKHAMELMGAHHNAEIAAESRAMFADGVIYGFKATKRIALAADYKYETRIYDYFARN